MARRSRRPLTAALAVAAGALLLGASTGTATASPTVPNDPSYQLQNAAGNHTMGSQIALHEGGSATTPTPNAAAAPTAVVDGIDVASYQGNVNWAAQYGAGKRFAYVKATEGTGYKNPYHTQQYNGSYNVGMIRGSYHFALPDRSSGAAQATYFASNGGGWSADGKTLPGALDMEYNPYGSTCYGKTPASMAAWIKDFHDTYRARTGRYPVIYTSTSWWNQCVGSGHNFGATVPLWIARYNSSVGALPSGWGFHTIWQWTSSPLDQNRFNGAYDRLQALARG